VTREGIQKRDVLVSGVEGFPEVAPNLDVFEEAASFNLSRLVRDPVGRERRPFSRMALANRVVDLLNFGEEWIEAGREGVQSAPKRQVPARSEQLVGFAIANRRVEPVPSGCGVDEVEGRGLAFPGLEGRDMDLDSQAV